MEILSNFDKLIDWRGFEQFVGDLYQNGDNVEVRRNVTEIGKSGSKRQIDVLVCQKSQFHNLKIVIECKYWKEKVNRDIIDKMFATIDDLNANKGVIFTTIGYEEGALKYAEYKNIDIFIVREILEQEWGKPGSTVWLYTQTFTSTIEKLSARQSNFVSTDGKKPSDRSVSLRFDLQKDVKFNPEHQLYALPGLMDHDNNVKTGNVNTEIVKGPNLLKVILDVRANTLKSMVDSSNIIVVPEDKNHFHAGRINVRIDFSKYPYCYLPVGTGFTKIDEVSVTFLQGMSQNKLIVDRKKPYDLLLMVENYISKQKHFISKKSNVDDLQIVGPVIPNEDRDIGDFQNGSIIKIAMDYYVLTEITKETVVQQLPDLTVNLLSKAFAEKPNI